MAKSKLRKKHKKAIMARYIAKLKHKKELRKLAEGFYKFLANREQLQKSQQLENVKTQILETGTDITINDLQNTTNK